MHESQAQRDRLKLSEKIEFIRNVGTDLQYRYQLKREPESTMQLALVLYALSESLDILRDYITEE